MASDDIAYDLSVSLRLVTLALARALEAHGGRSLMLARTLDRELATLLRVLDLDARLSTSYLPDVPDGADHYYVQ